MRTVLITGASSGVGATYADRLARRGYSLILVARDHEKLDELAHQIQSRTHQTVRTLAADLTAPYDLACVEEHLRSESDIVMLVNNAGASSGSPLLLSKAAEMEVMIALNITAVMRLTYAVVPRFVERGSGTIINISSLAAVAPRILNGVSSATKAFGLAFSESLRHEFSGKGLRIQVVLSGGATTGFYTQPDITTSGIRQAHELSRMSVDDLVDAALAGLDQGEFVTLPSLADVGSWEAFVAARERIVAELQCPTPAQRYRMTKNPYRVEEDSIKIADI